MGHSSLDREGMTLRDWFAGQAVPKAMQLAEVDGRVTPSNYHRIVAKLAYEIADAMLAQRVKSS